MARKDDPVFNVKFVELVEKQACLWNYTHPGYSKKEEVQKAWQHVANEIKDTVRNSRERWRTIRSSFLRSLKLARTQTGRGKRKYYLSKYLQFLIPYTKSRACHKQLQPAAVAGQQQQQQGTQIHSQIQTANGGMVLRKPSTSTFLATLGTQQPMTRIGHMRQQQCAPDEDTKDSSESVAQPSPEQQQQQHSDDEPPDEQLLDDETNATPLRLQAIKVEHQQPHQQPQHPQSTEKIVAAQHSLVTLPVTMAAALRNNLDWTELTEWLKCSTSGSNNHHQQQQQQQFHLQQQHNNSSSSNMMSHQLVASTPPPATGTPAPAPPPATTSATMTATVAAAAASPPDADYSFLISLHPYLKEMSGKQNRRFRQKVVGLIDNVLDNVDI
ncbi:ataxin-2 homolog [Drosophila albomicans]|uniref:Ataxin-2 homolog n=1 Tax=Drosophila albomicans TaxID=7291 RepID=A0A6P8XPU2_DROAB|nr:ataxin-2 homolog [Drosophila albomicans]